MPDDGPLLLTDRQLKAARVLLEQAVGGPAVLAEMEAYLTAIGPWTEVLREPLWTALQPALLAHIARWQAQALVAVPGDDATVSADVALFNQLVALWRRMWNDAGRYGSAGLKIRRWLIVFLALIIVTFVLDVAAAQAHLTAQQALDLTLVEGAVAVGVTVAKK